MSITIDRARPIVARPLASSAGLRWEYDGVALAGHRLFVPVVGG
jgi:hypothetical protein